MRVPRSLTRLATAAAVLIVAGVGQLEAQVTTGTIRGRVLAAGTAEPVDNAEMVATNVATGVASRTATDADGRYVFPALSPGTYSVQARRLGVQPIQRPQVRVRLGETSLVNFEMNLAPVTVEGIEVVAEATPLIDPDQTGFVDLVTSDQVEDIPVAGRNFADLVALSPAVGVAVGDGSGGNLSLGGGRRGASLIQIDGAGSTGTFFGGEARGSDRIPFAYSIESVREFQIVTNGYDVEYGFFSGGVVNAVTKTGTNDFHGSLFGYFRDDALTSNDFFDREPDFTSRQIGGTLSGPIVKDKAHFYLAVERQDRDEPVFALPAPGSTPDPSTGVLPDSIARFLDILERVYGVEDQTGRFQQTQDEWSIFGRIDWQISDRHALTLRHNFTDLEQLGDRVSTNETAGNGGVFSNTGNSTVATLRSVLSPTVWNEVRAQLAFEPRPRDAASLLPEAVVDIRSDFPDGSSTFIPAECCNDPVLPNNLEETTFEFTNNLHIRSGDHEFKIGGQLNYFDFVNFFFFRQQGRFRFRSLADFENGVVRDYARALPNPGPDNQFFTDDDILPLAEYQTLEVSGYLQDTWQVSDRVKLTGGVRIDYTTFPDAALLNQTLVDELGLRTDVTPEDANVSPRLSLTFDPKGDGRTVLRGGGGLFFGRFPSVLYSNSLLNQGENQLSLFCSGGDAPAPDYQAFQQDLNSIPTACAGGGAASPPIPAVNLFAEEYEYPRTLRASAGVDRLLTDNIKFQLDVAYATSDNNFYVVDRNLNPTQFTSAIEGRPVFTPANRIFSSGDIPFNSNRPSQEFTEVLEHVSKAVSRTWQVSVGFEQRSDTYNWQVGYNYSNTKDNSSYSCCISSTAFFETPTAGNPNRLGGRGDDLTGTWGDSDFDRTHTLVLSGAVNLPLDFTVSGIWRTTSGRPWTPIVDGDPNGDGRDNDRAFIGTTLSFDDPAVDIPTLEGLIAEHDCLREQVGRIASRNSCRNSAFTNLDLRIRKAFRTVGNQRFEIIADFFNVLNAINDDWSRNVGVFPGSSDAELLIVEGFDPATRTYTYSVNPSFGTESDLAAFRTDQFSAQLGVRYAW